MGAVAEKLSDMVFVTSDNPRSEDPEEIIANILSGICARDKIRVNLDRKQAIFDAVMAANENDIVLVAGKGHEDYQIIGTRIVQFDDRLEAQGALMGRS